MVPQMTKINQDNFLKLLEYLMGIKNLKRINVGVAGYSLYKDEKSYLSLRPDMKWGSRGNGGQATSGGD
jgi:hypothetical protein